MASGAKLREAGPLAGSDKMSHPGALATLVRLRWLSIAGQALAIAFEFDRQRFAGWEAVGHAGVGFNSGVTRTRPVRRSSMRACFSRRHLSKTASSL